MNTETLSVRELEGTLRQSAITSSPIRTIAETREVSLSGKTLILRLKTGRKQIGHDVPERPPLNTPPQPPQKGKLVFQKSLVTLGQILSQLVNNGFSCTAVHQHMDQPNDPSSLVIATCFFAKGGSCLKSPFPESLKKTLEETWHLVEAYDNPNGTVLINLLQTRKKVVPDYEVILDDALLKVAVAG